MSKKGKTAFALAEDFQAVIAMVPKLEAFIGAHKEIAEGYQKFRKNGGEAIPGIEKYLGAKEQKSSPAAKTKKVAKVTEAKVPEKGAEAKKAKKSVKK